MSGPPNRIALVTGASSGIGAACAQALDRAGYRLILAARRRDRLQSVAETLQGGPHCLVLDVRDEAKVAAAIAGLPTDLASIDLLVNNAGLSRGLAPLHAGELQDWEEMIDTNIKGLLYVNRHVLPGMVKRARGMVIHIGSIAGRQTYPGGNVYCATKYAVRAITDGMRLDLSGTGVRVCSIDPGMVETEFSEVRFHGDRTKADAVYRDMRPLAAEDVADAVMFAATRPEHVSVADMLLLPTDQASATLVDRRPERG